MTLLHNSGVGAAGQDPPLSAAKNRAPPGPGSQIGSAAIASPPAVPASITTPRSYVDGGHTGTAGIAGQMARAAIDDLVAEGGHSDAANNVGPISNAAFGSDITAELRDLARHRRFLIRKQSRDARACESHIASCLGSGLLPKGERVKVYKRAAALIAVIENELSSNPKANAKAIADRAALPAFDASILDREYLVILISAQSVAPISAMRTQVEEHMRTLARTLPAWPFVEGVRGASDLTLAIIVGEAGDPTAYRDKHTLCKRLGLGVVDGARQGNPGTGATADDWIRHGYNRERRADLWVFLSDVMIRAQWRAEKDGVPAHAIGPYGEIYGERKALYLAREWTPGHADKAARRYASKAFIRDLRNAWRNSSRGEVI